MQMVTFPGDLYTRKHAPAEGEAGMTPILESFLRYVKMDTTSCESSTARPSTEGQGAMLDMLADELRELGMEDVRRDRGGILYAGMKGSAGAVPIGLVAHVDTSPEEPGRDVKPILHEDWDGGAISLPGGVTVDPARSVDMSRYVGTTIVTSDGTTLLGADDKAGVAIIMDTLRILAADPSRPRPPLRIAFTPDEEIGRGVVDFDIEGFGARFAYTVDGGALGEVETQTFNAWSADLLIRGRQVHPGSAGGRMVNAVRIAAELVAAMRAEDMPENSFGMQGFDYPMNITGSAAEARVRFILRDFEEDGILARRERLASLRDYFARKHPGAAMELSSREQYRNPVSIVRKDSRLVEYALEGTRRTGLEAAEGAVRGGTDGSRLSFMGLPCVNLPTGGELFHSREEWISERGMELSRDCLVEILGLWSGEA